MTRSKPVSCIGCALHTHGTDFTSVEGAGTNGVLLVGEASGEHEQRDGLPFRPYAPSGAVLERCLRRMGMERKQFAITNTVRCRPRKNWLEGSPWEFAALRACRPNLDSVIAAHRPRCVVALGGAAMRELTGCAGDAQGVGHLAGYVLPLASERIPCDNCISHDSLSVPVKMRMTDASCDRCHGTGYTASKAAIPVIADFHPSYLRRGKASYQGMFSRIIQRAVRIASGADRDFAWGIDPADDRTWGMPGGERLQYWTRPTTDDARSVLNYLRDNPNIWVAKDIETSESSSLDEDARDGFTDTHVRQFQLSYQPGTGIAIPYTGEFRPIIREMLHLKNPTFGHNWDNFDHKVLRACAAREGWEYAPSERVFDTLDMFHHWQPDLPAHLQFCASFVNFPFPWKHLAGSYIEFYGICDVDADLRLGMFLEKALKKDGIWGEGNSYSIVRGYTGQEREVRPVLAGMEDRGVPVDDARRMALGSEFEKAQEELGRELDGRFPDEARSIHPKKGYKKVPKDCSTLVLLEFPDTGIDGDGHPNTGTVMRWARRERFAPNSSQQLLRYMKAKSHPIPKGKEEDDEGNTKDTTAKKELIRLAHKTGDTFYLKVIEYRELAKAKGTYVDGFRPGADGRVHTTFTFDTATAQTSSRNPNVQNFLKHGRLAKATRGIIAAPEGYTLAEADFKSYHVLTTGFEAECAEYMRMARLDMHSFIAGIFTRQWGAELMEQPDDALLEKFAWFKQDAGRKRVRDKQAKPSILGVGFGMKKRRLFQENMEHYANEAEAGRFLAILEDVFRPVFDWQARIQKQAHEQAFLKSRFGHIRRFYEVFRWDGRKGVWGHGDQAEEAVAFLPANHAFGNIRECMKAQERLGIAEKYGLCNSIHDSFVYVFPTRMREEFLSEVVPVLRAPSAVLTHPVLAPRGLEVDVEVAWGSDWASLKDVPLPGAAEAACAR